ncbi:MAG: hypothetical protein JXM79_00410 [Sedimentisphaerales bacterium]|nr:hypothetical protein [Sedimentisphaerales bacterium]
MADVKKQRKQKKAQTKSPSPQAFAFTVKQQKLVDAYDGDIKKAAKEAGLSYDYARRLVTKSHILEAIKNRQETETRPKTIATRQQRQQFWTETMNNDDVEMRDRLKASELLGKSEADFTENINNKFPDGVPDLTVVIEK